MPNAATKTNTIDSRTLRFEKPFSNKLADQRDLLDQLFDDGTITVAEYILGCQNLLIQDSLKSVGYNTFQLTPRGRERSYRRDERRDDAEARRETRNVDALHEDR